MLWLLIRLRDIYKLVEETDNEETLKRIKKELVSERQLKLEWDNLPQAVKDGIERGLKDFEEGKVLSHEEVMKSRKEKFGF